MSNTPENQAPAGKEWTLTQKVAFRIAFIFFILMCIPTSAGWYKHLFNIDWSNLHCRDLYDIARFSPPEWIKPGPSQRFGYFGYVNWLITLGVALAGGVVWTLIDNKRKEYNILYYWLRVIVRYRAGIGIIGFSFEKIFPTQMPYPSTSLLNNAFGDLSGHKIFWLSIGISPWYQVFTGLMEFIPGALLLFRRTTTLGAALLFAVLGTVAVINVAYEGGVHIYASYFVLLATFLLAYDAPFLYRLLIQEKFTIPEYHFPSFSNTALYVRSGVKVLIFIYAASFTYLQYLNFRYDPYKQPSTKGLSQLRGYYNVSEFKVNNQPIPYSPLDTVRWQEATFEKWPALTFRVTGFEHMAIRGGSGGGRSSSGTSHNSRDVEKNYEGQGVAGGRRVFHYYADTVNKVLYLIDKNVTPSGDQPYDENWIPEDALKNIGDDRYKINEKAMSTRRLRDFAMPNRDHQRRRMILKYDTDDGSRIVLKGIDEKKDSIHVVLDRVNKQYALSWSDLQAGEYD